jgi:signal transduction histidine kinase/CheY-like chemotaxis protein
MIAFLLRCLLGFGLFFAGLGQAASLEVTAERLPLGSAFEYFLDAGGQMDLADAILDSRYHGMTGDGLALGFRKEVLWGRVTLHNPAAVAIERRLGIDHPRLEQVSLFLPAPGGGYRRLENGLQLDLNQRPVQSRAIAFPLRIEAGASVTLYLRVQSRTRLSVLPTLWSPEAFERSVQQEDLLNLLSIGALLGLGLYAIILFPFQRDRAVLYLGLCLIWVCLYQASLQGYDHAYGWWDGPDWLLRSTPLFSVLATMFLNQMVADLIPLRSYGWHRVERGLFGLLLLQGALLAAISLGNGEMFPLIFPLVQASKIIYLGVSLAAMRQGFQPARFVFLGLLLSLTPGMFYFGNFQELLLFSYTYSQAIPAILPLVVSLSFFAGTSQRLDLLQRDKLAAQAEILSVQREASARLEEQVLERTRELQVAKEQAERADLAKGEFLARVSHELRTPLHLILGYAQVLGRDLAGKPRHHLALLEEGGQHLTRLVDDLLDFTRTERNGLTLDPKPAFVHAMLARLKDYGQALACEPRHSFESQFGDDLPGALRMDRRRLEQVMLILLSNAVQHTRCGRITLSVQAMASDAAGTWLRFAVEDTGQGIAPTDLARIFEPFEQAADGKHKGGLGLGLAIARQIVDAMGGELRVDSRPGEGSRFWFDLCLGRADEDEVAMLIPEEGILGYAGASRRILLVEDHAGNRRFLEQVLAEAGFLVQGAGTVGEALEWLAAGEFDLVLLDQRLPDGTAWDILRVLRGSGSVIPTVLLSAQPPRPQRDWGTSPGFEAVLLKPVNSRKILECVGGLLDLAWQREAPPAAAAMPGAQSLPSAAECSELAEYVRQGSIYEIEAWLEQVHAARPEYAEFCQDVAASLDALDFPSIAARLGCLED